MGDSLWYKFHSGKPNKFLNLLKNFFGLLIPDMLYRIRRKRILKKATLRSDYHYIHERVNYYLKIDRPWKISPKDQFQRSKNWILYTGKLSGYKRNMFSTAYYFDQHDITRWFPKNLRWNYCPGDVYFTPSEPTIVKSRLLHHENNNSILLKLDKLRHFMFVHDQKKFQEKKDLAIFRGKIRESRIRTKFMELYYGHPMVDCGVIGSNEGWPKEWSSAKKTIKEHLDYKFILALEGNDVASNLKWVMSSNSLAVMTRPTCETWFMEGTLIPNYHYVEIKDDFSDLQERLQYYIDHPKEAEAIIKHAHEYINQFMDAEREMLIQLLVLERYFELSGQSNLL